MKMDGFSAAKLFNLLQKDAVDFHDLRLPKDKLEEDARSLIKVIGEKRNTRTRELAVRGKVRVIK
jgi:hypothetical protein